MLVVDANILIRAVLGSRALGLIRQYWQHAEFVAPDLAIREASRNLPDILERRGLPVAPSMATLDSVCNLMGTVDLRTYHRFETPARRRLFRRDLNDWPILASALALNCPIWTEDLDFFGCGVATWTSDRVDIFLEAVPAQIPE